MPAADQRGFRRLWATREKRLVSLAVLTALVLRLGWAIWAAHAPTLYMADRSQYLVWARSFAYFRSPSLRDGVPSAFYPPGWPLALAPMVRLSAATGWFSPSFGAALMNALFGTATVAGVAGIARRWLGGRACVVAAWLMAVCPSHIYFVSSTLSETFFACVVVTMVWLVGRWLVPADQDAPPLRWAPALVVGGLVGLAALTRGMGLGLVLVPLLTVHFVGRDRARTRRAVAGVVLGALAVALPWTLRNAVQVGGVILPSSNYAGASCVGNWKGANGDVLAVDPPTLAYCWGDSPWVAPRDEAKWYRHTTGTALSYGLHHPGRELWLASRKVYFTFHDDGFAFDESVTDRSSPLVSDQWETFFRVIANIWYVGVGVLALVALATRRDARRALPVWLVPIALFLSVVLGHGFARFHHGMLPFGAVLASSVLAPIRLPRVRRAPRDREPRPTRPQPVPGPRLWRAGVVFGVAYLAPIAGLYLVGGALASLVGAVLLLAPAELIFLWVAPRPGPDQGAPGIGSAVDVGHLEPLVEDAGSACAPSPADPDSS